MVKKIIKDTVRKHPKYINFQIRLTWKNNNINNCPVFYMLLLVFIIIKLISTSITPKINLSKHDRWKVRECGVIILYITFVMEITRTKLLEQGIIYTERKKVFVNRRPKLFVSFS